MSQEKHARCKKEKTISANGKTAQLRVASAPLVIQVSIPCKLALRAPTRSQQPAQVGRHRFPRFLPLPIPHRIPHHCVSLSPPPSLIPLSRSPVLRASQRRRGPGSESFGSSPPGDPTRPRKRADTKITPPRLTSQKTPPPRRPGRSEVPPRTLPVANAIPKRAGLSQSRRARPHLSGYVMSTQLRLRCTSPSLQ